MREYVRAPVGREFQSLQEMRDFYAAWVDDEVAISLIAHGCPPELIARSIAKIRGA